MATLRSRQENSQLFFDFRWNGTRYRAQTNELDCAAARKRLAPKLRMLNEALQRGTFDLATFFPELVTPPAGTSVPMAQVPAPLPASSAGSKGQASTLTFSEFANQWYSEFRVGWRKTYDATVRGLLDQHLLPRFGPTAVSEVNRAQILEFRAHLAKLPGRREGTTLSPARINTIMLILRQILQEAADRYEFTMPMGRLKPLKIPKSDVMPFTLNQVQELIARIRPDYKHYLTVRFFTGMRSGEIHGLKWKYVDFERRLILVRETIVGGEEDYTKTDASQRDIVMSSMVYDALVAQKKATGHRNYVFCNLKGEPLDTINFTKRVWYPLLRHLGLELRRPYQTRHTAATLWLAAGEMPEWIARQLGHASTEMLFRVYSRYVPNLTRNDGSAFDRMLQQTLTRDAPSAQDPQPPPSPWLLAA